MGIGVSQKSKEVRDFILSELSSHPINIVSLAAEKFDLNRKAVNYHMRELVKADAIVAQGNTRQRKYFLKKQFVKVLSLDLENLSEHTAWQNEFEPFFKDAPQNIYDIWEYGVTEMINNAIDHSAGNKIKISILTSAVSLVALIDDDGVGIFKKIAKAFNLENERQTILELAKGKLTTDPDNHTGEGIFFTSRCFDVFNIYSGDICFNHNEHFNDEHWIIELEDNEKGTTVMMELHWDSDRVLKEVIDQYASEDGDYAFNRTVIPVNLLKQGRENLVSRSQAKRLMTRVEDFKTVILDFDGIDRVGQAFADEIFRVFVQRHPEIKITPARACAAVRQMISRASPEIYNN